MKLKTIVPAVLAFLAPALVLAQITVGGGVSSSGDSFFGISLGSGGYLSGCSSSICGIGETILYIINSVLVPVLFAVAFFVFLYGIAKAYIFSGGSEEERAKGHKLVLWGVIAFAVMISIWGLVNVVANTFGLSGYYAPSLPTSY
jgi:hypothetical protein